MKKGLCLLCAVLLALAMSLSVFAEGEEGETTQPSESVQPTQPTECAHSYGSWEITSSGHSRKCGNCGQTQSGIHEPTDDGVITTPPACNKEGVRTFTCAVCGGSFTSTVSVTGHTYRYEQVDASTHKQICKDCGEEKTFSHEWQSRGVSEAATCQKEGKHEYGCICGATRYETIPIGDHSFSEWGGDEVTHSRSCSICGKTESGKHNWYGGTVLVEPTCKEAGVMGYLCTGCDMVLLEEIPMRTSHVYDNACDPDCNSCGEVRQITHKYATYYSKNATGHWYACTVCGDKKDFASHVPGPAATEEKEQVCLVCNYVMMARRNHTHSYDSTWTSDEEGHWHACSGCEEQKDFQVHSYDDGCDETCNVCGYLNSSAHSYGAAWQTDENGHWKVCTLCEKESEHAAHTPGEATGEDGNQFCTECGYLIASGHTHSGQGQWLFDEEKHWQLCSCQETVDEAPHDWDAGTEENGIRTYICRTCGQSKQEMLETEPAKVEKSSGMGWIVPVFVVLGLIFVGCVAALIVLLKPQKPKGKYSR